MIAGPAGNSVTARGEISMGWRGTAGMASGPAGIGSVLGTITTGMLAVSTFPAGMGCSSSSSSSSSWITAGRILV